MCWPYIFHDEVRKFERLRECKAPADNLINRQTQQKEIMMEQAKLGFRPKRSNYTREFFMESRYMHETYPEHYSPEKPFTRRRSPVKQPPLGSAPHVYKLMGSLYKEKEPEPEVEPQEPDFKS